MNTRRNFFRSIALLGGAASISPQIFIPKFEPVKWKESQLTQKMLDDLLADLGPEPDYWYLPRFVYSSWLEMLKPGIFPHNAGYIR